MLFTNGYVWRTLNTTVAWIRREMIFFCFVFCFVVHNNCSEREMCMCGMGVSCVGYVRVWCEP